jgi:hypothetical protein
METNQATIRYMAKYLFKDIRKPTDTFLTFATRRPGIGFYGISQLSEEVAKKFSTISQVPSHFLWRNRRWPLDKFCRDMMHKELVKRGVEITYDPLIIEPEMELYERTLNELPDQYWRNFHQKEKEDFINQETSQKEKEAKAEAAYLNEIAKAEYRRKNNLPPPKSNTNKEEKHLKAQPGTPPEPFD